MRADPIVAAEFDYGTSSGSGARRRRCLTGSLGRTLVATVTEDAPRLSSLVDVPAALDDIVARMLARDPAERPHDGDTVLALLRDIDMPKLDEASAALLSFAREIQGRAHLRRRPARRPLPRRLLDRAQLCIDDLLLLILRVERGFAWEPIDVILGHDGSQARFDVVKAQLAGAARARGLL